MSLESHVIQNGELVHFDATTHTYWVDNVQVPSITELLRCVHGDKYKFVNPELLERSAVYGTKVHKEIQDLIELRNCGFDIDDYLKDCTQETRNYFNIIEPIYKIKPVATETVVVLHDRENKPVAAGRFDLMAMDENNNCGVLCDFKTTSSLVTQSVSDQLNLYKIACEQCGCFPRGTIKELAAIHISGEQCKLKFIPIFGDAFYEKYIQAAKKILNKEAI